MTRYYDPAYVRLDYPRGDVPADRGVCTDVIVRAFRDAFDVDLQKAVHEDMERAFGAYPEIWGLSRPDRNIDHRRVPNLETFLTRQGARRPLPRYRSGWLPGDLATMRIDGLPHIAIVSDRFGRSGARKVIHNMGWGAQEDDVLRRFDLVHRFRFAPSAA